MYPSQFSLYLHSSPLMGKPPTDIQTTPHINEKTPLKSIPNHGLFYGQKIKFTKSIKHG
jgi:hypothetical protein